MQPFSAHTGKVMPLDRVNVNVDTDQMVRHQRIRWIGIQLFAVGFVLLALYYLQNTFGRWFQATALALLTLGVGVQLVWLVTRHRGQGK